MTKVFIGGSRAVSRLSAEVQARLDTIMEKGFSVLVGDANGADKAAQMYLNGKGYPHVEVFCTEGACRNNVGGWAVHGVAAQARERNAEFYSAKDRVMAEEADFGLMLWDGKSVGTLMNVFRLLELQKKAVVYIVPQQQFLDFKSAAELERFIEDCSGSVREKFARRLMCEAPARKSAGAQASLAFG
jgi:hypothetical protein